MTDKELQLEKAYNQGWNAFARGYSWISNPYNPGKDESIGRWDSELADAWDAGWNEAEEELREVET